MIAILTAFVLFYFTFAISFLLKEVKNIFRLLIENRKEPTILGIAKLNPSCH
jgi:hypothetical protein